MVGLSDRLGEPAGRLSHGEQRQLEIGVALATGPRLLLLDEPTAGMSPEETLRMTRMLEALPRDKEGNFERIRMAFGASGLQIMELVDGFGQTTVLKFNSLERNPKLDPALFRFSPPKGADVIGDLP